MRPKSMFRSCESFLFCIHFQKVPFPPNLLPQLHYRPPAHTDPPKMAFMHCFLWF
uniref:Uncharacterized protein n=1 Tax=Anguilla anguilla TaxID=7936 RepID=A0A0E9W9G5_ANGAN